MDSLTLALEPSERKRLAELDQRKPPQFGGMHSDWKRGKPGRNRGLPAERIRAVQSMLNSGIAAWRIRYELHIGYNAIGDIRVGRYTENGRLPPELEIGERYCDPPKRCEVCGGAWIRIEPCRACKARQALEAKR
jgi:hypothetical protein